jgi:hypothetical protein
MLQRPRTMPSPEGDQQRSDSPPTRVLVKQVGGRTTVEPILDGPAELADFQKTFYAAFGTIDGLVAEALFGQLLNGLHAEPGKPLDNVTVNLAIALMHEIGPRDVVEAMLACQMIVAHVSAMDASRRALHAEQRQVGRHIYLGLTRKLMTLFTAQMDILNRHRGKATVQRVVVEKVLIAPGAQAVVGAVASRREGDGG